MILHIIWSLRGGPEDTLWGIVQTPGPGQARMDEQQKWKTIQVSNNSQHIRVTYTQAPTKNQTH